MRALILAAILALSTGCATTPAGNTAAQVLLTILGNVGRGFRAEAAARQRTAEDDLPVRCDTIHVPGSVLTQTRCY